MNETIAPLSSTILAINYFGDVVFAISGALCAMRYRMDIIGVLLIAVITGIGGGTMRDLIIGRPVFWAQDPTEFILIICVAALTFFFINDEILRKRGMVWGDAMGLAAFGVLGCHIALSEGIGWPVAVLMGMVTAIGGGMTRDVITNTQPMILSGQLYATAALVAAGLYCVLESFSFPEGVAEAVAFFVALALRAAAIHFDIRTGPRDAFIRIGGRKSETNE